MLIEYALTFQRGRANRTRSNQDKRLSCKLTCWRRLSAIIIVIGGVVSSNALAQTSAPTPQPSPTPSLEKRFLKNILQDQRAIWTSPFHLEGDNAKWLIPLGVSTGALIATDRRSAGALDNNRVRLNISRDVSYLGSDFSAFPIAGSLYVIGRMRGDARLRETGLLGAQALIDGYIVSGGLKAVTQRRRPRELEPGDFFEGGRSFPSGHAISSWSLATVVANEYQDKRLVQVAAYGLATAVSISRFTGRKHFLSDVLVGSAIGYGIGRYVYRTHHDSSLDSPDHTTSTHTQSKLWPLIRPGLDHNSRSYGVWLSWQL